MRVCLVNLWDKGGMLHYSAQLANGLTHLEDADITIFLPRSTPAPTVRALFKPEVAVRYTDVITTISIGQILHLPWQLIRIPHFLAEITRLQPDIIHITAAHVWLILTLPWLARRYPVVTTLHDVTPHPGSDDSWRKRLEIRTLIAHSREFFVHGQPLKQQLLEKYPTFTGAQVHLIPHGDYAFFQRWQTGQSSEPATILFFGRICEYKGLSYLLEAYAQVREVVKEAKLIIAGEGPLGDLAEPLSCLPNLEVHNRFIPDQEVSALFERASLVVCPYIEASQSGVIPIAYAAQKPVVATRVGSLPQVIEDGRTGLLVPPRDAQALAWAIIKLLQNAPLRAAMGGRAYQKMKAELGWDKIASTTWQVYQQSNQPSLAGRPVIKNAIKRPGNLEHQTRLPK